MWWCLRINSCPYRHVFLCLYITWPCIEKTELNARDLQHPPRCTFARRIYVTVHIFPFVIIVPIFFVWFGSLALLPQFSTDTEVHKGCSPSLVCYIAPPIYASPPIRQKNETGTRTKRKTFKPYIHSHHTQFHVRSQIFKLRFSS